MKPEFPHVVANERLVEGLFCIKAIVINAIKHFLFTTKESDVGTQ